MKLKNAGDNPHTEVPGERTLKRKYSAAGMQTYATQVQNMNLTTPLLQTWKMSRASLSHDIRPTETSLPPATIGSVPGNST
jgi:hypothetical protein